MTNREICEKIVRDKGCDNIVYCRGCPLNADCSGYHEHILAEQWIKDNPEPKKIQFISDEYMAQYANEFYGTDKHKPMTYAEKLHNNLSVLRGREKKLSDEPFFFFDGDFNVYVNEKCDFDIGGKKVTKEQFKKMIEWAEKMLKEG